MECFGLAHAEVKYRFLSLSKKTYILSGECSTPSQLLCYLDLFSRENDCVFFAQFAHHEAPAIYASPSPL